jgi:quinol monooxygenase YgiN
MTAMRGFAQPAWRGRVAVVKPAETSLKTNRSMNTRKATTMYGTIARFQIKPGMEAKFKELEQEYTTAPVAGFVATYVYRMDATPHEYYMAVVFASKEAYQANAGSPEQDARYRKFRELLAADPEWHDGEIVSVTSPASG